MAFRSTWQDSDSEEPGQCSRLVQVTCFKVIFFFLLNAECSSSPMYFSSALPATIMDLTILRLSGVLSPKRPASSLAAFVFGNRPSTFRRIHQAAALTSTNVPKLEPFLEGRPTSSESNGRYAPFASFSNLSFTRDKI